MQETKVKKTLKFVLISGVFDLPAKAMFLDFMQFSGYYTYYGCAVCEKAGQHCSHVPQHPMTEDEKRNPSGHSKLRTKETTEDYANEATHLGKPVSMSYLFLISVKHI